MKSIAIPTIAALLLACGVDAGDCSDTSTCSPPPVVAQSVCQLPSQVGVVCSGNTPEEWSWTWVGATDAGESTSRCNVAACPSGATCIVENKTSTGSELLMGLCQ